eukprot:7151716-Lingulodinium_polyedra.AAC.1
MNCLPQAQIASPDLPRVRGVGSFTMAAQCMAPSNVHVGHRAVPHQHFHSVLALGNPRGATAGGE